MLVSPNGPAYGSRPKLVVMKVLCKLRWRKIRHPLAFSHSVFLFIHSLYSSLCFCLTVYFLHRHLSCSSLSPFITSSLFLFFIFVTFPLLDSPLIFSSLFMLFCLSISLSSFVCVSASLLEQNEIAPYLLFLSYSVFYCFVVCVRHS